MKVSANKLKNQNLSSKMCLVYGTSVWWGTYAKKVYTDITDYTYSKMFSSTNFVDWDNLINEITAIDLFSDNKLLEINLDSLPLNKKAISALNEISNIYNLTNSLLFTCNKSNASLAKYPWFNNIVKSHLAIQCFDISVSDFENWIKELFKHAGYNIDNELCEYLSISNYANPLGIQMCLTNIEAIKSKGEISLSEVEQIIFDDSRCNAFSLINVALSGNKQACITIVDTLQKNNTSDYLVLMAITKEIRALYNFTAYGKAPSFTFNKIANTRKMQLKSLTTLDLNNLLQLCARIEKVIKGLTFGDSWGMMLSLCLYLAGCQTMQGFTMPHEENTI